MRDPRLLHIILLVAVLAALGQITNTIYVPAMSQIAHGLVVRAGKVQAVMACYLIMYGVSQFFYGPLSDYFGRRPCVLVGVLIFCIGSLVATCAPSLGWLEVGSLIQGAGAGVGGMMARSAMRDLYTGRQLHVATSYMSSALIIAPLLGPLLGGVLSASLGWRADFAFLLFAGIATMLAHYYYLPETNRYVRMPGTELHLALRSYWEIASQPRFQGYVLCLMLVFGGVSVFEASAGILFAHLLHYSPLAVSLFFVSPLFGYLLGAWLAGRLHQWLTLNQIIMCCIVLLALGAFSLLLTAILGWLNIYAILIPICFYFFGSGMIFPAATAGALEPFGQAAGKAGALLGGLQNLGASACTFVSASLTYHSQLPLAMILVVLTLLIIVVFRVSSIKNVSISS